MIQSVLLADDDTQLRGFFALFLRSNGWQVAEAGNGTEALKAFRTAAVKPALVVLDIRMQQDGLSTCRTFTTDTFIAKHRPKIAILSAADRGKYEPLAKRVGADMLLSKPITAQELHFKLKRLLNQSPAALQEKRTHRLDPVVKRAVSMAMLFQLPPVNQPGGPASTDLAIALDNTYRILREQYGSRCSIKKVDERSMLLLYVEPHGCIATVNRRAQHVLARMDHLHHCEQAEQHNDLRCSFSGISLEALARLSCHPSVPVVTAHLKSMIQQSLRTGQRGAVTAVERFYDQID